MRVSFTDAIRSEPQKKEIGNIKIHTQFAAGGCVKLTPVILEYP